MQEQNEKQITQEELRKLEENAVEKFEKGDKPYHKKYRKKYTPILCYTCKSGNNLILITDTRESSFKKNTHKKNRNRVPLLDKDGNKIYLCKECLIKRAKKAREKNVQ